MTTYITWFISKRMINYTLIELKEVQLSRRVLSYKLSQKWQQWVKVLLSLISTQQPSQAIYAINFILLAIVSTIISVWLAVKTNRWTKTCITVNFVWVIALQLAKIITLSKWHRLLDVSVLIVDNAKVIQRQLFVQIKWVLLWKNSTNVCVVSQVTAWSVSKCVKIHIEIGFVRGKSWIISNAHQKCQ